MAKNNLEVAVKMYRLGEIGDCFLLKFKEGDDSCHVLIDCGSFRNNKDSQDRLKTIWENIRTTLNGAQLDVVVGTHQHNDHLSGFIHGQEILKDIAVGQVWLSWLDDPRDSRASVVRSEQEAALVKLKKLAGRLHSSSFAESATTHKILDLLQFSLNLNDEPVIPAKAVKLLKQLGSEPPAYLDPGQVLSLPGLAKEVKVYVLGPPKDKQKLQDIHASAKETYDPHLAAARIQAQKLLSALDNHKEEPDGLEEAHFPFTDHYTIPRNKFAEFSPGSAIVSKSYNEESWRKIDEDWLEEAGNLALYMDRYTNNTSLVLAFHLVRAGKFLLFVGDAQTGNWNSWKDINWPEETGTFSINTLLNNTILYKAGHHCSHNATTVEGLEAMTDENLVVLIPVDCKDANITPPPGSKRKGWKMPAKNLYNRLRKKTGERIMRMDTGFGGEIQSAGTNQDLQWKNLSLKHQLTEDELYLEYKLII